MKEEPLNKIRSILAVMAFSAPALFATQCATNTLVAGTDLTGPALINNNQATCVTGNSTLLAQTSQPFVFSTKSNAMPPQQANGNLLESVYKNNATGFLDFYFQVTNCGPSGDLNCGANTSKISTGNLMTLEVTDYTNVLTSAAYVSQSFGQFFNPAAVAPESISRGIKTFADPSDPGNTLALDTITFDFGPSGIAPGSNSAVLLIRTNVTDFDAAAFVKLTGGTTGLTNVRSFSAPNYFEPLIASTPEPAFYGMMGLGLLGLFTVVRRRRATADSASLA
jgi:hypothetical protein